MARSSPQLIMEAAAEWVWRRNDGPETPQDRDAFLAWLDADPAHPVAYAQAERAWERTGRLAGAVATSVGAGDGRFTTRRGLLAAGLAAGLGIPVVYWLSAREQMYETPFGGRREVRLPDGSLVTLNTATKVAVRFSRKRRDLRLIQGEAMFLVAKDVDRPFVVTTAEASVRAVGTAFDIRLREGGAEVSVVEGVVRVDPVSQGARQTRAGREVRAGEVAFAGPGEVLLYEMDEPAMQARTAWRRGLIELRGETLEQALAEFRRYTRTPIVISDPRIASIRVGGTFRVDETERFLEALNTAFDIQVDRGPDNTAYLRAKPKGSPSR